MDRANVLMEELREEWRRGERGAHEFVLRRKLGDEKGGYGDR